jgi:hypothetical protein
MAGDDGKMTISSQHDESRARRQAGEGKAIKKQRFLKKPRKNFCKF